MVNCTVHNLPFSVKELSVVSSVLSIIGSLITLITYWRIPEIRNLTRALITWLSAADFLTALGIFISGVSRPYLSEPACKAQSFITTMSTMVSFYLPIVTAIYIFITVVTRQDLSSRGIFLVVAVGFCWSVPGAVTIAAAAKDRLGNDIHVPMGTASWCWIKCSNGFHDTLVWTLITGKVWEVLCYFLTTTFCTLVALIKCTKFRNLGFRDIHSTLRNEDWNFTYVWLVILGTRIWGTIRYFLSMANGSVCVDTFLLHMQALGDPALGFCNFILFCLLDETVRKKMCACCYKEASNFNEDEASLLPSRRSVQSQRMRNTMFSTENFDDSCESVYRSFDK